MRTHKVKVTVSRDHNLSLKLPEDFPLGPADVIVHAEAPGDLPVVKLAGILTPRDPGAAIAGDPIADVLDELRRERAERSEKVADEVKG